MLSCLSKLRNLLPVARKWTCLVRVFGRSFDDKRRFKCVVRTGYEGN